MSGKIIRIRVPKANPWAIAAFALFVLLAASLLNGWSLSGKGMTGKSVDVLSAEDVAKKCVDYLNENLVQPGTTAKLLGTKDLGGVYEITTSYLEKNISVYSTKDGKMLFLSGYLDMSKSLANEQAPAQESKPAKLEKPVVQLFVMSFCPYGIQAEQAMKPVVDLLGSKAIFEPHFIVSISGSTVGSLHGEYEANEDMRQACIWKDYGQVKFWNYVGYINDNCNKNNLDTCWKDAAKNVSIDTSKVEGCVASDGLNLMKAEEALSGQNGVSGSPTLIINGVTYNGGRTSEAYKQAICSAFTNLPAECSSGLSTAGGNVSGGCG